jgi:hypothetical protein
MIMDPAPLAFFEVRVLRRIAADFKYTKINLERDLESLFNEKILTIEFEKPHMYSRIMKLLCKDKF